MVKVTEVTGYSDFHNGDENNFFLLNLVKIETKLERLSINT